MSDELTLAAARVARGSFREWEEFLAAYDKYAEELVKELIQAPGAALQVSQGRAQQAVKLATLLRDAVKSADRIQERRAQRDQNRR